jgi:tyrosyl-tRNA synthetase
LETASTDLPLADITCLEGLQSAEINEEKILATETARLCHGDDAARDTGDTARVFIIFEVR